MLKTGVVNVDPRRTFSAVIREAPSRSAAYAGQRTVPGLRDRASKVCWIKVSFIFMHIIKIEGLVSECPDQHRTTKQCSACPYIATLAGFGWAMSY